MRFFEIGFDPLTNDLPVIVPKKLNNNTKSRIIPKIRVIYICNTAAAPIVDALTLNLALDGTWPEVLDAACLKLGVAPTGSLQEKGEACWRAMEK